MCKSGQTHHLARIILALMTFFQAKLPAIFFLIAKSLSKWSNISTPALYRLTGIRHIENKYMNPGTMNYFGFLLGVFSLPAVEAVLD
jgi:hypothetical protein